jgi:hypothetical protein
VVGVEIADHKDVIIRVVENGVEDMMTLEED